MHGWLITILLLKQCVSPPVFNAGFIRAEVIRQAPPLSFANQAIHLAERFVVSALSPIIIHLV